MHRYIILIFSIVFVSSCSGKHEERMAELDSVYGVCDNPARNYKKGSKKYELCKDKERAQGQSLFGFDGSLSDIISGSSDKVVYQSAVNPHLWNASLQVTQIYPLKIADNQGGFIETDWIYEANDPSKRCLLKIQVVSRDLVTTGVTSSFLCETKQDQVWVSDQKDYIDEEKQITLKILEIAGNLSKTTS